MTGIRVAGADVSRIMCGGDVERVVCAGVDIWKRKYEFSESFPQGASYLTGSDYAPNWTEVGNTSTVRLYVDSYLEIGTLSTSTSGTYVRSAVHNHPLATDQSYVQARIAQRNPTSYDAALYLHADSSLNGGAYIKCSTDSSTRGLYVNGTRRASFAFPTTGTIRLTRQNMGSYFRYIVSVVGGSTLATWDDTGNVSNVGPDYRYVGLECVTYRNFFGTTQSNGWDDFYTTDF